MTIEEMKKRLTDLTDEVAELQEMIVRTEAIRAAREYKKLILADLLKWPAA